MSATKDERISKPVFSESKRNLHIACYTLIIGAILMSNTYLHAGNRNSGVSLSFNTDTLPVQNGTVNSLILKVRNHSASLHNACVKIRTGESLELFSKSTISPLPAAGHSLHIPVCLYIPVKTASGCLYPVTARLETTDGHKIAWAVCTVRVTPTRKVSLSLPAASLMIHEDSTKIKIPVRLTNKGNTPQTVSVILQTPGGRNQTPWHKILKAHLLPFADTIVYFRGKKPRSFQNKNLQQLTATGVYANGDPFGRTAAPLSSSSSNRNFRQLFALDNKTTAYNGRITMTGRYLFTPNEAYQVQANGNVLFSNGRLNYRFDISHWKNNQTNPILVRNTALSFKHRPGRHAGKYWGITAGHISRNYERHVTGRGISAVICDSAGVNRLEAGFVQENYNLFSSPNKSLWRPSTSFWISWQNKQNKREWSSCLLLQKIPCSERKIRIWSNTFTLRNNRKQELSFYTHIGNSSSASGTCGSRTGVCGEINFRGHMKAFTLSSKNLLSTAYYPGLQQGALILQQQLSQRMGKNGKWWAVFSTYRYHPKQLPGTIQRFINTYGSSRAGTGVSIQFKQYSLSFLPEWSREKNKLFAAYNPDLPAVMESWDLNTTLSCHNLLSGQQLAVSATLGITDLSSGTKETPFHLKAGLNWHAGNFSLTSSWQYGCFHLGETASAGNTVPGKTYHMLLVSPNYGRHFLNNRGTADLGLSWITGSQRTSCLVIHWGIRFRLNAGTETFIDFIRYRYRQASRSQNNLQAGISSVLPPLRLTGSKRYTLEILAYKDLDKNKHYDSHDSVGSGMTIRVGTIPFRTNAAGIISYRNVPSGKYPVSVVPEKGWYAEKQEVTLNRSVRLEIALQQAGILKGGIHVQNNDTLDYTRGKMNTSGMMVLAISSEGKSYRTQSGYKGDFIFFLPAGDYTVSLQLPDTGLQCLNNGQTVRVDPGNPAVLEFSISRKHQKIEIKRFTDISMKIMK